jgi:hypothetical protein
MLRTATLLLLTAGVTFAHLVAVPHLHGGDVWGRSSGDARPHFHLAQLGRAARAVAFDQSAPQPGGPVAPATEHDADAWYVDDARAGVPDPLSFATDRLANGFATAHFAFDAPAHVARSAPPAPPAAPPCPLFVRHLALLL